ncbi:MAG: hypothetical protein M3083_24580 [Actinomycetota bacterium]|nr:hypothetical protein [Actinomycetota bacterium]
MGSSAKGILAIGAAAAVALLNVGLTAGPASAVARATVAGPSCVGNTDTLSWSPPHIAGLTGYHIVKFSSNYPPGSISYDLPRDQTSMQFSVAYGLVTFSIYAATSSGVGIQPFATGFSSGVQAPQPMQWDFSSDGRNSVGDRSVTVAFLWSPQTATYDAGNAANDTVTVTASPGGATITSTPKFLPPENSLGVIDTFTGLTNGVSYTFTSVVTNACGTSGSSYASAPLTPNGPAPGALTCFVSSTQVPPAVARARQSVQVQAADGLAAISNIHVVNGTVKVPAFSQGTTSPVVVTATKTTPGRPTSWSFGISDLKGQTRYCG